MDVKNVFLSGFIKTNVYEEQLPSFEDYKSHL